jgi:hypothetical protein
VHRPALYGRQACLPERKQARWQAGMPVSFFLYHSLLEILNNECLQ